MISRNSDRVIRKEKEGGGRGNNNFDAFKWKWKSFVSSRWKFIMESRRRRRRMMEKRDVGARLNTRCRTLLKFPLYNWILLIGKSIRFMSLSICQFVAIAYDSSVSKSLIVQLNDLFYRRGGEGKKERSNLSEAIIHSANRFGLLLLERNILINLNAKFLYSLITA